MKKLFILFLLSACSGHYNHFLISNEAYPEDVANVMEAIDEIDNHLGCLWLSASVSAHRETVALDYHSRIAFSNQPEIYSLLQAGGNASRIGELAETDYYVITDEHDIASYTWTNDRLYYFNGQYDDKSRPIYVDGTDLYSVQILIHEFGHAMGLQHSKEVSDIMAESVYYNWDRGITGAQWDRYLAQLKAVGVECKNLTEASK